MEGISKMKGQILDVKDEAGLILGDDGYRYDFYPREWKSEQPPVRGMKVDFEPYAKEATAIYTLTQPFDMSVLKGYRRSRGVAILIAIFLGFIGGHKFYLGRIKAGVIYLLLSWTFIPVLLTIWDVIVLITMSDIKFNTDYNDAVL
jgi:TM2 domain-containing membrane protein YozV